MPDPIGLRTASSITYLRDSIQLRYLPAGYRSHRSEQASQWQRPDSDESFERREHGSDIFQQACALGLHLPRGLGK